MFALLAVKPTSTSRLPTAITPSPANGCRIAETLPEEVLTKMHAGKKTDYPTITPEKLTEYDGFLLGIPTRYGNFPAQWKVCFQYLGDYN